LQPTELTSDLLICPPQLDRLDWDTASQRAACQAILLEPTHPVSLEGRNATRLGTYRINPPPTQRFSTHYTLQLDKPLMSTTHRSGRQHLSQESPFQKPWAEGEILPADTLPSAVIY